MITTYVRCGLGNQLFQIYTLISYCLDNNIDFYIYNAKNNSDIARTFYWDNIFINLKKYFDNDKSYPIYQEPNFHFKKIPKYTKFLKHYNNLEGIKLSGFFQSYKYFNHNKIKINNIINIESIKNSLNLEKSNNIDFNNTCSLHFRLGDYLTNINYFILPINYYIDSLNKLINDTKKNDWNVLYFYEKDSSNYITEKIHILKNKFKNLNFISIVHKYFDWEQLLLMSLCRHNIIANSSFSWWGAYFNNNPFKTVCYPDKWFGPKLADKNVSDMFPDNWTVIKT